MINEKLIDNVVSEMSKNSLLIWSLQTYKLKCQTSLVIVLSFTFFSSNLSNKILAVYKSIKFIFKQ